MSKVYIQYVNTYCMAEIMLKGFKCERCGHEWARRGDTAPKVCPKCKSPYWNTPRKEKQ